MRSTLADPNIPLSGIAEARARRNFFIEENRRYQIAVRDPNRKRKAPWKVRGDKPAGPTWEFERDKTGKITLARQLRPMPDTMDTEGQFIGKRFLSVIEGEPCLVGGEHVEHGCKVDSLAQCAFDIHNVRGRILEEYQA